MKTDQPHIDDAYKTKAQLLQELRETRGRLEAQKQRVTERTLLAETRARQLQALAVELIEAEELERQRIAELLHGDLQQLLASAKMQLDAWKEMLPDTLVDNVGGLLMESINKSRHLSHELSPPVLQHSGLVGALRWLVEKMHAQFGLCVKLNTEAVDELKNEPFKTLIFRAVQELLFNIVKHAGVKEASVDIALTENTLSISVSDQGRGFDPCALEQWSTKTGIGIIRIRERASRLGGRFTIASAPGKGSRFTLLIPLSPVHPPPSPQLLPFHACPHVGPPGPSHSTTMGGANAIRVLFADDHKVMRQGLIQLVANQPDIHVVGEAANGRIAFELARQLQPDLIVMDVSMPEMDGIMATRLIKTEMPKVRVVGLSMFEDEQVTQAMRLAGADAFISKTASSAELLRTIYSVIQNRAP
jgi:CheY-like chemotaxis protein